MIHTVAPAKINLALEVLGKRDDGYHEIRSVLQTIELHDELMFEAAADFDYEVKGPYQVTENDTVIRAASLFAVEHRVGGVHVKLDKRVPVASGLGGGSSDAAATLRAMNEISGARLNADELAAYGAAIGSDVPFFAYGGTALASGRGEQIARLPDLRQAWLVLVVPAIPLEDKTRSMYEALLPADFTDGALTATLAQHIEGGGAVEDGMLCNAFERAAYERFEGLAGFRDWILEAGAKAVHLSGAGPALFAIASGEPEARAIRGRMNRARRGERVYLVRTIPASEAALLWTS